MPSVLLSALCTFFSTLAPAQAAPCCSVATLGELAHRLDARLGLPSQYLPGALLLRDDPAGTMYASLVELARRQSGRKMLQRLVDSGFITTLVSERLRPMQAGLWGPIFSEGRVVGATLYIDLMQIRSLDHDPTGVETLAHEIRHQIDAARAFNSAGTYRAVYRAAASGDQTRSAQRHASRVRQQKPDFTPDQADRWLGSVVVRLDTTRGELIARSTGRPRVDSPLPAGAPHNP